MHGCRWSIGDGASIKVMGEPWLRGKDETWVPSPQEQGVYNITVHELMNSNEKVWDKEKIESLFPSYIAKSMLNVPLFNMIEEDKLVWFDNIHGEYSVKSGYNLMLNFSGEFKVWKVMEIGIVFGKFMLHQRLNISYGGYVEVACQLALDFKKGVYHVLYLVRFVIIAMRMICMWCLTVMLACKADKLRGCSNFFFRGCRTVGICVKLY
jgi:hypothetical protein